MANETRQLAAYAAALRYQDLPDAVVRRAKDCLIDTVAAIVFGHSQPAGRIAAAQMTAIGQGGASRIIGGAGLVLRAECAAFANGVLAHAFELDSLRKPGAGVHPGAVLVPAALAAAQEHGTGGRAVLAALVAGCEVLFRVGKATKHTPETRGFHAPGLTGPFGAAVAVGHIAGLDADAMKNALGIAGSLAGGLLEFAKSGSGGMVKRLHLGRAAESGVLAARLAANGFTGPDTVLEGAFGFLHAYCLETDIAALTEGLGERYETLTLCLKRYPCHITAHTPVTAIMALRQEHEFRPEDVRAVVVEGSAKMAELHANQAPRDLVLAQYSIPFCVAIALTGDPRDPERFSEAALHDELVRVLCRRVEVRPARDAQGWATTTRIELADGRRLERHVAEFPGTPAQPMSDAERAEKFMRLTRRLGPAAAPLFDRLEIIEREDRLDWLGAVSANA
jgi:2-methylcitrate dehydratase PrpD